MSHDALVECTEAAMIGKFAREALIPEPVKAGALYYTSVPVGTMNKVVDLEEFLPEPRRMRGTTELHDQASFARLVNEYKELPATHLYASLDQRRIVAVVNDYGAKEAKDDKPDEVVLGWGDHRICLSLRVTPEWKHWADQDGKMLSQVDFAEHVEDGLDELVSPDGATMLELSQTFHASTSAAVRQAVRLDNGEIQVYFEQTIAASAGRASGGITIPSKIELGIAPFEGTQPYRVEARLRYRLNGANLSIGYRLVRPHLVVKSAFEDAVRWIEEDTGISVLRGVPLTR